VARRGLFRGKNLEKRGNLPMDIGNVGAFCFFDAMMAEDSAAFCRRVARMGYKRRKTRNGKIRTLSHHGELAGAGTKRPELVRSKGVIGPVIVGGETDVLPSERREMHRSWGFGGPPWLRW
jgi:hypothetical protein